MGAKSFYIIESFVQGYFQASSLSRNQNKSNEFPKDSLQLPHLPLAWCLMDFVKSCSLLLAARRHAAIFSYKLGGAGHFGDQRSTAQLTAIRLVLVQALLTRAPGLSRLMYIILNKVESSDPRWKNGPFLSFRFFSISMSRCITPGGQPAGVPIFTRPFEHPR